MAICDLAEGNGGGDLTTGAEMTCHDENIFVSQIATFSPVYPSITRAKHIINSLKSI